MFTEDGRVNDYLKFMSVPVFRRLSSYSARLYTDDRIGHLKTILGEGGGNLSDPSFKLIDA